jgi:hypothetical protein
VKHFTGPQPQDAAHKGVQRQGRDAAPEDVQRPASEAATMAVAGPMVRCVTDNAKNRIKRVS